MTPSPDQAPSPAEHDALSAHGVLQAFPSPVVVFDADTWRPLEFNDSAARLMGYSREEFSQLDITEFEAEPNPSQTRDHVGAIARDEADTFVRVHKRKDGTPIRVLISVRWTNWFGTDAMLTTWHDVAALPTGRSSTPDQAITDAPDADTEYVWADRRTREVLHLADRVAATDVTVLISGETGSGKELLARRIHAHSTRRGGEFVPVNCAAIPSELVESEMFGHTRGAFSGAVDKHRGLFAQADGGTLFLDEIGELPHSFQSKLLRVLEDKRIRHVGASVSQPIDVRIVAATNRDLGQLVACSEFRADLFYRLNEFPIRALPLRERPKDLPVLVEHFLENFEDQLHQPISRPDAGDLRELAQHDWPGNVRELRNVVRRAAILSKGQDFSLPTDWCDATLITTPSAPEHLDHVLVEHLQRTLIACGWKIEGPSGAAKRLGMSPSTLRYRMRKLGIVRPERG